MLTVKGDYTAIETIQSDRTQSNFAKPITIAVIAYGDKGEYDRAIEDYNKAIALNPDLSDAYYNRGMVWLQVKKSKRRPTTAIEIFVTKAYSVNLRANTIFNYHQHRHNAQLPD